MKRRYELEKLGTHHRTPFTGGGSFGPGARGPLRSFKDIDEDSVPVAAQRLIIEDCEQQARDHYIDTTKYTRVEILIEDFPVTMSVNFYAECGASFGCHDVYFTAEGKVLQSVFMI